MALSNWDAICFYFDGDCCVDPLEVAKGETLGMRKNRLWFRDVKGEVQDVKGSGAYGANQVNIQLEAGWQESIYWCASYEGQYCGGIGCFSYRHKGLKQDTFKAFLDWLAGLDKSDVYRQWFSKVVLSEPRRYNQGDAYLANRAGIPVPDTVIGEAESPLLLRIMGVPAGNP